MEKRSVVPCADILVNVGTAQGDEDKPAGIVWEGCDTGPCTHWDNTLGVGLVGRLNAMDFSNSNAVAVALSYLIYLKKTLSYEVSVSELIKIATNNGNGMIQDPIRYRHIQIYADGNLDS